ncbi:hypothetical protein CEXT_619371 [Caerostris extrusa]|uniref:Uncharacterized protein n=1 Tax=Caerostris extrusa TaxID=172846 RepID=A0AAV4MER2_CAEEX|nr:hypothetical protein CEXT_619371 [Caerostris extrusa]
MKRKGSKGQRVDKWGLKEEKRGLPPPPEVIFGWEEVSQTTRRVLTGWTRRVPKRRTSRVPHYEKSHEEMNQKNPEEMNQKNPEGMNQKNPEEMNQKNPEEMNQKNPEEMNQKSLKLQKYEVLFNGLCKWQRYMWTNIGQSLLAFSKP